MPNSSCRRNFIIFISLLAFFYAVLPTLSHAASASEITTKADEALKEFRSKVPGGSAFLERAKGVLVFPNILKAGFWIGGEYGEGALKVNNRTISYYSIASASIGLQAGAQSKTVILGLMTDEALRRFQEYKGWKAGVDGSVALVEWGAAENVNTLNIHDPIVGFIFNNKGLMVNLTLEGSKLTRIKK